jgi:hypothetical protein
MRGPEFEPLVAAAKERTVELARADRISLDDARFLLRVLEDLEADGAELFDSERAAGDVLCRGVERYLGARVGLALVRKLGLVPFQSVEVST